jgi:nitroreductase
MTSQPEPAAAPDLDLATVDRLLSTTRSVRRRLDTTRPVPDDVIRACLELASQAPSPADVQTWRWVVVTDPGTRKAIAAMYREANEPYVRSELERLGDEDSGERRRFASVIDLIERLDDIPVLVVAYVVQPDLPGLGDQSMPPALLYGGAFPAAWSFQLALRARGLGTTPLFVADEAPLAEIVGAPANAHLVGLFPVAYYTGTTFKPAARRPLAEVAFTDSWGTPLR